LSTALLRSNGAASIDTDSRGRIASSRGIASLTTLPWDHMSVRITEARAQWGMLMVRKGSVPDALGRAELAPIWTAARGNEGHLAIIPRK
jgi:hypothetical protein